MRKWGSVAFAAATLLALVVSPLRAMGGEEGPAVHAKGECNMGSTWELVMERETGVKFEATIETGVPDQDWHIIVKYERNTILDMVEQTEEDGGFEVIIVESNKKGEDHATVLASNLQTGERCWGKLSAEL
jgi:hypothetical protein